MYNAMHVCFRLLPMHHKKHGHAVCMVSSRFTHNFYTQSDTTNLPRSHPASFGETRTISYRMRMHGIPLQALPAILVGATSNSILVSYSPLCPPCSSLVHHSSAPSAQVSIDLASPKIACPLHHVSKLCAPRTPTATGFPLSTSSNDHHNQEETANKQPQLSAQAVLHRAWSPASLALSKPSA